MKSLKNKTQGKLTSRFDLPGKIEKYLRQVGPLGIKSAIEHLGISPLRVPTIKSDTIGSHHQARAVLAMKTMDKNGRMLGAGYNFQKILDSLHRWTPEHIERQLDKLHPQLACKNPLLRQLWIFRR